MRSLGNRFYRTDLSWWIAIFLQQVFHLGLAMGDTTEEKKDDAYFQAKHMMVVWITLGVVSGVLVSCLVVCGLRAWCCSMSKTEDEKKAQERKARNNRPPSEVLAKKREKKKREQRDNKPYRNKALASLRGQAQRGDTSRPETRASVIYDRELGDYTLDPEDRTGPYDHDVNMANYSVYDPRKPAYRAETPRDKSPTESFSDNMRRPLTTDSVKEEAERYLTQYRKNLTSSKGKKTLKGGKKIYTA